MGRPIDLTGRGDEPLKPKSGKVERPRNSSDSSVMRKLKCVMAVENNEMSMVAACDHFNISARTLYRWLRKRDTLLQRVQGVSSADVAATDTSSCEGLTGSAPSKQAKSRGDNK